MFSLEGAKLTFTEEALFAIAQKATKRSTGARALRSVMEEVMIDLMYDLPDMDNSNVTYVIDQDAIERKKPLADLARRLAKESA
jgi:ATP-dependent Clp protease ATP-binding subunit ClpX